MVSLESEKTYLRGHNVRSGRPKTPLTLDVDSCSHPESARSWPEQAALGQGSVPVSCGLCGKQFGRKEVAHRE